MRKKHRRKLSILALGYAFLLSCGTTANVWSAASGNYTDLLPIGAAGNTTLISNGTGWSLTTLPPTQTFGDSLSRVVISPFQTYVSSTVANTTTEVTVTSLAGATSTGSSTYPAAWVQVGRSIRITMRGRYGTTGVPNWTWKVKLGTTTIMTTNALAAPADQTSQWFTAQALLTISTTAVTSTINGTFDIFVGSGAVGVPNVISYSTSTLSAAACDLASQLSVNPTFTWGTASTSNSITFREVVVEFLN